MENTADKMKVGVIGVGHHGQHHARIFSQYPGCELVGIVDTDRNQAKKISKAYRAHHFPDYKEMIGKVQAVSIATPTVTHFTIAKDFLENGVHVLIEKPITETVDQAQELIDIAKKKGLVLQVGHIERFNVAVKKLKKIIKKPGFIEAHRLGPFDPRIKDVGVVMDLMIHDIDIILQIVPSPVKSIEAVGMPILSNREDIANVRLKFENGCIANITTSRVTPKRLRKLRIFQEDCYISLDYIRQNMDLLKREPVLNPGPGEAHFKLVAQSTRMRRSEPLKLELEHFIECIQAGSTPDVTGEHAKDALELVVKISRQVQESMKQFATLVESKETFAKLPDAHPLKNMGAETIDIIQKDRK